MASGILAADKALAGYMWEFPSNEEGLGWIMQHGLAQMLLIPGLQPASIVAAAAGDQQALAYLRFMAQQYAAFNGVQDYSPLDSACVKSLEAANCDEDHDAFIDEFKGRDPQLFHEFFVREESTCALFSRAIADRQLAALKWLQALCPRCTMHNNIFNVMWEAAACGNLDALKQLRTGPWPAPWNPWVASIAAHSWPCISWLLSEDPPCPSDKDLLPEVVCKHSIDELKWLQQHAKLRPEHWNAGVTTAAARAGKLPMLQYLRAQDPPVQWDASACRSAVSRGDMPMLQWMRSSDAPCPWDESVDRSGCRRLEHAAMATESRPSMPLGPDLHSSSGQERSARHASMDVCTGSPLPLGWDLHSSSSQPS